MVMNQQEGDDIDGEEVDFFAEGIAGFQEGCIISVEDPMEQG